jgi:hypothetical protein
MYFSLNKILRALFGLNLNCNRYGFTATQAQGGNAALQAPLAQGINQCDQDTGP